MEIQNEDLEQKKAMSEVKLETISTEATMSEVELATESKVELETMSEVKLEPFSTEANVCEVELATQPKVELETISTEATMSQVKSEPFSTEATKPEIKLETFSTEATMSEVKLETISTEATKPKVELETFSCSKCSFVAKIKSSLTRHLNKAGHHENETDNENAKNNKLFLNKNIKKKPPAAKQIKIQAPTTPLKKENTAPKTNVDLVNEFKQDIFCEFLKERRVIHQSIKLKDIFMEWMVVKYPNTELDIDINDDFMKKLELSERIEGIIGPSGRYCWVSKSEHASRDEETKNISTPDAQDIERANDILKKCGSENLIFGMKDALTAILLRRNYISSQRLFDELLSIFPTYKPNANLILMRMLYVLNQEKDFVKDEQTNVWTRKQEGESVANGEDMLIQQNNKRKIEQYEHCDVNTENKVQKLENGSSVVTVEN